MSTATQTPELSPEQRHILEHTLGAGADVPKRNRGYRNRYCANCESQKHAELMVLVAAGLMREGNLINEGRDQMFYATAAGCDAVGLSHARKKFALED